MQIATVFGEGIQLNGIKIIVQTRKHHMTKTM